MIVYNKVLNTGINPKKVLQKINDKIKIINKINNNSPKELFLFFLAFIPNVKHLKAETVFISPVEKYPNKKY